MSNQDDSQNTNDRKADMSQITGKQESATTNRTQTTQAVATHSLSDVANARTAKVGTPTVGSTGLEAKKHSRLVW